MSSSRILVGVDGSEHSTRAVQWCADHAAALDADCSPTVAIMRAAETEHAEFVVAGRRGRGGFAELVLGSTSHQLSHHLDRPLVIVP